MQHLRHAFYQATIQDFLASSQESILGILAQNNYYELNQEQRNAWLTEISLLQNTLTGLSGFIFLEYLIPRMGKRTDVILLVGSCIFVVEFKVGSSTFEHYAIDQVIDYALDLKNFHEGSATRPIFPVLWATQVKTTSVCLTAQEDGVFHPLLVSSKTFRPMLDLCLRSCGASDSSWQVRWITSGYHPTPTIIEAAQTLYAGHSVQEISRNDAGAFNLSRTTTAVTQIIENAKANKKKVICFITGVPGAGKTLAGLSIANSWQDPSNGQHAVFLSGNGPLVKILRAALVRDEIARAKGQGIKLKKADSERKSNAFIQNIHHFRDDMLRSSSPPVERVAIFDEAQRAWDKTQASSFMQKKRGMADFSISEPEFLLSVMDRHTDWAVIVCLIGGGQEINTGEAGISEWLAALKTRFSHWQAWASPNLHDEEYRAGEAGQLLQTLGNLSWQPELHLATSIRSFRSEKVSAFVKAILDADGPMAKALWEAIRDKYPIVLTRDVALARQWLREKARGTERYGLIASSGAQRLKAIGLDIKSELDEIYWFLNDKNDVRSSYYLESIATEFHIQGLELDWTGLIWDADLRFNGSGWDFWRFRGTQWQHIQQDASRMYLKNAYRVLLTRARQGMVIVIPEGNAADSTRPPLFYDPTYDFFENLGLLKL